MRPAKTQISLGIRPVWSESSLSAWRNLGSLVTHWAHIEDSDQTGRMTRLIWVFAGRTVTLFCRAAAHFNNYVRFVIRGFWLIFLSADLLNVKRKIKWEYDTFSFIEFNWGCLCYVSNGLLSAVLNFVKDESVRSTGWRKFSHDLFIFA